MSDVWVLPVPSVSRKALAFVEALNEREVDFGYRLDVPTSEAVQTGTAEPVVILDRAGLAEFAIVRDPDQHDRPGSLRLAVLTS